jgi:hypothetical protein
MWLRRGTLEPILLRELGCGALEGNWILDGRARLKAFPLGVVGHWPAGNIEIQPILSMTCALLGGNASLVRVPSGLEEFSRELIGKLAQTDTRGVLTARIRMLVFPHRRQELQEAMARVVDGAMVWGGEEAVLQVRSLPFPHWARLVIFGPRISIAAMDANSWCDVQEREAWCRRIARDVWQFDQQACSSPQVLFLEKKAGHSCGDFVQALKAAFQSENRLHPRQTVQASLTTAICQARASWLLDALAHRAIFPWEPDWTLLIGNGSEIPKPTQGKTLTVLEVDDLSEALKGLDPNSKEAKQLQKTLDKLGEEGKGNIKINFGDAGKTDGQPNLGRTVGNSITINYDAVDSVKTGFNLNQSESEALDAGVTTHEGAHAGSGPSILGFVGMHGQHAAYFTESVTYQGLHNTDRPFLLWNESWLAVDQHTLNQNRENAIQNAIHPPKQPEQPKQDNPQ